MKTESVLALILLACTGWPVAAQAPSRSTPGRLRYDRLRPELQVAMAKFGNRLSAPERETLVLEGTLTRGSGAAVPFRLLLEPPHRFRFEEGPGGQGGVSGFDGDTPWKNGGQVQKRDLDVLESALFDSMDRFFYLEALGRPTRKIGSRFRLMAAGGGGPSSVAYDIYGILDEVKGAGGAKGVWKWFYVNCDTLLLDIVEYRAADGGAVRTVTEGWQQVGDQWVPRTVVRTEKGQTMLRFQIAAASLLPRQPEGTFQANRP